MFHDLYTPQVLTSVAWGNGSSLGDDYAVWCGCPSEDPAGWMPPGENGCFHSDPMLVCAVPDHDTCDFHLLDGSPCWGAGTPAGTNIGAYPSAPQPLRYITWGRSRTRTCSREDGSRSLLHGVRL